MTVKMITPIIYQGVLVESGQTIEGLSEDVLKKWETEKIKFEKVDE